MNDITQRYMIFDLDGTILDSMGVWDNLGYNYLKSKGIYPPKDLDETTEAMTLFQAAEYFRDVLGLKQEPRVTVAGLLSIISDKYKYDVPMKEGAFEFITNAYNSGIKMCVLSSSESEYIHYALERLFVGHCFAFILTCSEAGLTKDSSEIYLMAAERLGAMPKQTAVFEDAPYAAASAADAGFFTIGVYDEFYKSEEEAMVRICDIYIKSFTELI